ncbi:MAG: hypothetical protein M1824_002741 [Vezdaea acicularis]|nr:MAG: hypothetical protein M1824_002741 [Vezdaea acicularis]
MLSSLPSIHPHDAHKLWYTPPNTSAPPPPTATQTTDPFSAHHIPSLHSRRNLQAQPTPLARLSADENAILARKLHIQRFGAHWLRPPGVAKTLAAGLEEKAEREERMAETEAEMEEGIEFPGGVEAEWGGEGEEGQEEERDLDDDVPDADVATEAEDEEPERDLDDDVPSAEADEEGSGEWEHTDTEDEESDGSAGRSVPS